MVPSFLTFLVAASVVLPCWAAGGGNVRASHYQARALQEGCGMCRPQLFPEFSCGGPNNVLVCQDGTDTICVSTMSWWGRCLLQGATCGPCADDDEDATTAMACEHEMCSDPGDCVMPGRVQICHEGRETMCILPFRLGRHCRHAKDSCGACPGPSSEPTSMPSLAPPTATPTTPAPSTTCDVSCDVQGDCPSGQVQVCHAGSDGCYEASTWPMHCRMHGATCGICDPAQTPTMAPAAKMCDKTCTDQAECPDGQVLACVHGMDRCVDPCAWSMYCTMQHATCGSCAMSGGVPTLAPVVDDTCDTECMEMGACPMGQVQICHGSDNGCYDPSSWPMHCRMHGATCDVCESELTPTRAPVDLCDTECMDMGECPSGMILACFLGADRCIDANAWSMNCRMNGAICGSCGSSPTPVPASQCDVECAEVGDCSSSGQVQICHHGVEQCVQASTWPMQCRMHAATCGACDSTVAVPTPAPNDACSTECTEMGTCPTGQVQICHGSNDACYDPSTWPMHCRMHGATCGLCEPLDLTPTTAPVDSCKTECAEMGECPMGQVQICHGGDNGCYDPPTWPMHCRMHGATCGSCDLTPTTAPVDLCNTECPEMGECETGQVQICHGGDNGCYEASTWPMHCRMHGATCGLCESADLTPSPAPVSSCDSECMDMGECPSGMVLVCLLGSDRCIDTKTWPMNCRMNGATCGSCGSVPSPTPVPASRCDAECVDVGDCPSGQVLACHHGANQCVEASTWGMHCSMYDATCGTCPDTTPAPAPDGLCAADCTEEAECPMGQIIACVGGRDRCVDPCAWSMYCTMQAATCGSCYVVPDPTPAPTTNCDDMECTESGDCSSGEVLTCHHGVATCVSFSQWPVDCRTHGATCGACR